MGSSLPITQAILAASFVVAVAWGFHIVSLGFCMHALYMNGQTKSSRIMNWIMVAVSWILFISATLHLALALYRMMHGFTSTGSPEDTAAKLLMADWTNVARTVFLDIQTLTGDAVLIYRCWIVYNRSFLVIAPSVLLYLGVIGSTIWSLFLEATLNVLFNAHQITHAITVFWSLTIALNIITTSLLVYRISSIDNANRKHCLEVMESTGEDRLRSINNIIIESGLLYTIVAIATFGTYVSGSNGVYLTSGVEVQIVGIAFNLIIVRTTYLGRRPVSTQVDRSHGATQTVPMQFASQISTGGQINPKTEIYISSSISREVTNAPAFKV